MPKERPQLTVHTEEIYKTGADVRGAPCPRITPYLVLANEKLDKIERVDLTTDNANLKKRMIEIWKDAAVAANKGSWAVGDPELSRPDGPVWDTSAPGVVYPALYNGNQNLASAKAATGALIVYRCHIGLLFPSDG